jgi:hypothetical protein
LDGSKLLVQMDKDKLNAHGGKTHEFAAVAD